MAQNEFQAYCVQRSFLDFDELTFEARQWDLDFNQLDSGRFHGELLQFGLKDVHISEACFSRVLNQKGTPPVGLRTIVVPANRNVQFIWRGKPINGNQILIFPYGSELSSVSTPGFHIFTCSFSEQLLASVADSLQLDELDDLCGNSEVVQCTPTAIEQVRQCLRTLCDLTRNKTWIPTNQDYREALINQLPQRILGAIATSAISNAVATSRKRELALTRAESVIAQSVCGDLSVGGICRTAQVSQRTLNYAFRERFGMTPKAFLITYRLNAARKLLRVTDPANDKVKDIALRFGFWHMGQFAADYRNLFGELPSQTLRRVCV